MTWAHETPYDLRRERSTAEPAGSSAEALAKAEASAKAGHSRPGRRPCRGIRMATRERLAHQRFVKALQGESLACDAANCRGLIEVTDTSQLADRVKTFDVRCHVCGKTDRLTGQEELHPPWDDASLLLMADEHLMHQQPSCPNDGTPVVFTSLPNPRRRARYRISCYYCGRRVDVDWPPPESRG